MNYEDSEAMALRVIESIEEEYGVDFNTNVGQQDGIREQVQESQNKLNNINKNSVVDSFSNDDLMEAIAKTEATGSVRDSMRLKLAAQEEAKKND